MLTPGETKDSLSDQNEYSKEDVAWNNINGPHVKYEFQPMGSDPTGGSSLGFNGEFRFEYTSTFIPPEDGNLPSVTTTPGFAISYETAPYQGVPLNELYSASASTDYGMPPRFSVNMCAEQTIGTTGLSNYSDPEIVNQQNYIMKPHGSMDLSLESLNPESRPPRRRPDCLLEDDRGIFIDHAGLLTPPVSGDLDITLPRTGRLKVEKQLRKSGRGSSDSIVSTISSVPSLGSCTSVSESENLDTSTPPWTPQLEECNVKEGTNQSHPQSIALVATPSLPGLVPRHHKGRASLPKSSPRPRLSKCRGRIGARPPKIYYPPLNIGLPRAIESTKGEPNYPSKSKQRTVEETCSPDASGMTGRETSKPTIKEEHQDLGLITPPESRRTSGREDEASTQSRGFQPQPLPPLNEVLSRQLKPEGFRHRTKSEDVQMSDRDVGLQNLYPPSLDLPVENHTVSPAVRRCDSIYDNWELEGYISSDYQHTFDGGARTGEQTISLFTGMSSLTSPYPDEGYYSLEPSVSGPPQMAHKFFMTCYDTPSKNHGLPGGPKNPKIFDNVGSPVSNSLLPASPEASKVSTLTATEHIPSNDDEDSGYREETAVKVQVLYILIQFFLLREYHLKSQSASTTPFSRSSSSAENYPDIQSEECENLDDQEGSNGGSYNQCAGNSNSGCIGSQGSQTQKSRDNPRKRKKNDQEDRDKGEDGDGDDQRPNKKRSKHVDLNSLNSRLACPFAKGKPSHYLGCALIGRQDLPGVKEHLKRNHFNGTLPPEIRRCNTWELVFMVCNPDWDPKNPIPSRYLDIGFQLVQTVTGVPWPVETLPVDCQTPQNLNNPAQDMGNLVNRNTLVDNTTLPPLPSSATPSQSVGGGVGAGITQTGSPSTIQATNDESHNAVHLANTSGLENTNTQYNLEPIYQPGQVGQFALPQALNNWIKPRAAPHLSWPAGDEFAGDFNAVPDYLLNTYGFDMNMPPAELYPRLQNALNIPDANNTTVPLPAPIWFPNNPTPSIAPPPAATPMVNGSAAPYVSPSISAYTPGLTQNTSDMSTITPFSTPSQPRSGSTSNQYTLIVARKHPVPGSLEGQAPKQFDFDSYENFRICFEAWVLSTFTDPPFSWETMEFLGADPEIDARLSSVDEVCMNIRMWHIRHRTSDATLYLVWKDKGKQKASPR
ncbi:hypothetical protein TWF281_010352 [Arthrobotrys megalospora]